MNKNLIITIQENEAHLYEFFDGKLMHLSTIDNDQVVSYKESNSTFNLEPTNGGVILDGNEGQWKKEVNKSLLKDLFVHLQKMPNLIDFADNTIVIFFSSNTPKHDLEDQINQFKKAHLSLNLNFVLENKNLHDHEVIQKEVIKILD
jgi:hypothetical protein